MTAFPGSLCSGRAAADERTSNWKCPLSEYQMSPFTLRRVIRWRDGEKNTLLPVNGAQFKPVETSAIQLAGDDLSGKVKLKVEPLPTSLSTQILPQCSSTNFLAKVRPSPVPSLL